MANTITPQFIVDIEDESLINDIRRAIKMIKGVKSVHKVEQKKKNSLDSALEDIKEGRVHHADSVKDLLTQILGED